jgi:hypothetical protein
MKPTTDNPFAVERNSIVHPQVTHHPPVQSWLAVIHPRGAVRIKGKQLGHASSTVAEHSGHGRDEYATRGKRCSACRWFEARIYRVDEIHPEDFAMLLPSEVTERYLVVTVGFSIVPGETPYVRATFTSSGYEVVELLTIRKSGEEPFMPVVSARALSQAAEDDRSIRDAYVNRAIA